MRETSTMEGHQIFITELTRFARRCDDPRITALIDEVRRPLEVAVRGRAGVGRTTVARALAEAGVAVTDDERADVDVVVVAEAIKPEDRAMLGARPALVVLNKADLAGFGAGGPIAVADRRAAEIRVLLGTPTVSMVALLAVADVDDELVVALQTLVSQPADLTSADAFLSGDHSVARDVRIRLLETLDLFGIAHGVLAIRQGTDAAALPGALRRLGGVGRVRTALAEVSAEVRYQRMLAAEVQLRAMAACGLPGLADFLAGDDAVVAAMAAAVDVVQAAGLTVDADDRPEAHLKRAVHWQRYSLGPVNRLHQRCGADIRRGSLRLLRRAEAR